MRCVRRRPCRSAPCRVSRWLVAHWSSSAGLLLSFEVLSVDVPATLPEVSRCGWTGAVENWGARWPGWTSTRRSARRRSGPASWPARGRRTARSSSRRFRRADGAGSDARGARRRAGCGCRSSCGPGLARASPRVTQAAAVGVAKALWDIGVEARIKWPNDLLVDGRKICGILAESSAGNPRPAGRDAGLRRPRRRPQRQPRPRGSRRIGPRGRHRALRTRARRGPRRLVPRHPVETRFRARPDPRLRRHPRRLAGLNCTLGENVCVWRFGKALEGRAADLSPEGALLLETPEGRSRSSKAR